MVEVGGSNPPGPTKYKSARLGWAFSGLEVHQPLEVAKSVRNHDRGCVWPASKKLIRPKKAE